MPTINQAIVVNTSVVSPSETFSGWGAGAIVGLSSYATKNTAVKYTSLSALTTDHGANTAVGRAGASAFAQGISAIYTVAIDAAGTTPTTGELTTALNALLTATYAGRIKAVCLAGIYSDSSTLTAVLKTWADANDKIFVVTNPKGATVSNITTAAAALASPRGFFAAHNTQVSNTDFVSDVAAAALGAIIISQPGETIAWAKVKLPGVGQFTDGNIQSLETARCNAVDDLENSSVMRFSNGLTLTTTETEPAQYIDTTISRMYITDTLRNSLAHYRLSTRKVPYTSEGIEYVRSTLIAAMDGLVADKVVSDDYSIVMPSIDDISDEQRRSRTLSGISVSCKESGNMQQFTINLTMEAA